jgi:hypothetical protein
LPQPLSEPKPEEEERPREEVGGGSKREEELFFGVFVPISWVGNRKCFFLFFSPLSLFILYPITLK